jgi:hypothetical protein
MNLPSEMERRERNASLTRAARELRDEEIEGRLADAERELALLRKKLEEVGAWCDALDAEKDRRAIQRRAG